MVGLLEQVLTGATGATAARRSIVGGTFTVYSAAIPNGNSGFSINCQNSTSSTQKAIAGGISAGTAIPTRSFPIRGSGTTVAASNPKRWRVEVASSNLNGDTIWVLCAS